MHVAIGSVNGFRGGLRHFPHGSVGVEASGGYVRVSILREEGRIEYTDGWSATAGGSWYAFDDATISPLFSLLLAYVRTAVLPLGHRQTRLAVMPSLGSEYVMTKGFSIFFRFGPAFQFTTERGEGSFETVTQFDAGLSLDFSVF